MAEENIWVIESWETWWSLKEWVTEADVQRVQENTRQAKKVAQQLQQSKKENNQLANFLSFLLSEITNEKIIKWLYNTFFITVDPKSNIPYFRKNMNNIVVVWLFYPFYREKAKEVWISHYYEKLKNAKDTSIDWYLSYLQDLSDNYHDNIPINQDSFIQLLTEILKEFLHDEKISSSEYKEIITKNLYS